MQRHGRDRLVLLGGLTTAYDSFIGRAWEASVGLFLIIIGALLLFIKVDR